jgi:hypothetical protein
MIVRKEQNGWLLINQPTHSWLAGRLAAAWGNAEFAYPTPGAAVILATHLHDIGWLSADASPRLTEDGNPVNFLDTTLAETIPVWRLAVWQVAVLDPFAALLVSKHASKIYERRLERAADPPESRNEIKFLLAEQESFRAELRSRLVNHVVYSPASQAAPLNYAYRWLRVCDLMSLFLCASDFPKSGEISEVPGRFPDEFVSIHYDRPAPFTLTLEPSPFSEPELQFTIQTRWLPFSSFDSQASFKSVLEQAPWHPQTARISSA